MQIYFSTSENLIYSEIPYIYKAFQVFSIRLPHYYVSIFVLITVKNKIMTKQLRHTTMILALLIASSSLMAQDAQTPAPAAPDQTTPAKKSCHMADYCALMKKPPKKGFHHSIEWGGIYLGPRNQVSYQMFGHTVNTDMRDRNAIRMNAGYQFNPYLYVGGGMGVEFQYQSFINRSELPTMPPIPEYTTTNYTGKLIMIPVYGEVKGYLLKKPVSPFLQLRVGYAPVIYAGEGQHNTENSSYNNISVGVNLFNHVSITAGYMFIYQPTSVSGYDETNNNSRILSTSNPYQNRLTVGIAIGM